MAEIRGVTEEQARAATPERGWLKAYVKWAGAATDANLAYHLVSGLSVLSQSVPIDYGIPFGALPIYCNMYSLLIGDSTDARKTTAVKLAARIASAGLPERIGAEPGSAEAVVDELFYKPQQIVFIEEYGALLASTERGYATAIKTKWTQAYDGGRMARVKANKKGVVVDNPRLSLLAGGAPGYVERHTEPVDWTEGFLARHTTILANRERLIKKPLADLDLENRLVTWLKAVGQLDSYSPGGPGPCLGISDEAIDLFSTWTDKLAAISRTGRNRMIAPALSRATAMAIKVAGLLAWDWGTARTGGSWQLGGEEMCAATKIIDLHVQSVLEIGEWLAPDKSMRDRRKVLALIDNDLVSRAHVLREAQMLKREFDNVISTLMDERMIHVESIDGQPWYMRNNATLVTKARRSETAARPEDDPLVFDAEEPSPFTGEGSDPAPSVTDYD